MRWRTCADLLPYPLQGLAGLVEEEDAELVASDPCRDIAVANRRLDHARDGAQRVVSGRVAECVVDLLEAVDVDVEDRHGRAGQAGAVERSLPDRLQSAPVVEAGQLVEQRQLLEHARLFCELRRLFGEAELSELVVGDVSRDSDEADDQAAAVAQRHLRRRHPGLASVLPGLSFLDADQLFARLQQPLFVGERLLRVFVGEEIEVRLADGILRVVESPARSQGSADADEPALRVLEVDLVRDVVQQRVEQIRGVEQLIDPRRPQDAHVVVHI